MKAETYKDVPATPTTEQLHDPPTFYQVEHIAIGMANPIDNVESLKSFFSNSIMLKIPRFSSVLVKHPNGRRYWRKTEVDIDEHFVVRSLLDREEQESKLENEDVINEYIAELAFAEPMSTEKPLWEIHVLVDVRCLVLRIHHAIGDGISLMSLIRVIGESSGDAKRRREKPVTTVREAKWRWNRGEGLKSNLMYVWNSMVFCSQVMAKGFLVKDKRTVLNDKKNKYAAFWPQKLATASFDLDDVNMVKKAFSNATINDVTCGIIWGGFMKYIDAQSYSAPKEGQQIRGLLMANVRRVSGLQEFDESGVETWWGNKTGCFTLPFHYTKRVGDGLGYVRKAKFMLDKKKRSIEPRAMIQIRNMIMHLFGVKGLNHLLFKLTRNYTFVFSNIVGPPDQISIADNPIVSLKFSVSSSPVGIVMHLLSYMKKLELQILVAEDVIPDPKSLAGCFIETLQEMKGALKDNSKV